MDETVITRNHTLNVPFRLMNLYMVLSFREQIAGTLYNSQSQLMHSIITLAITHYHVVLSYHSIDAIIKFWLSFVGINRITWIDSIRGGRVASQNFVLSFFVLHFISFEAFIHWMGQLIIWHGMTYCIFIIIYRVDAYYSFYAWIVMWLNVFFFWRKENENEK